MGEALPADRILKELAGLWATQGRQAQAEEGAGVLRACTMTLVVLSEESDDASSLGETIAALMPEHPARAILVRLSGASGGALEQRVYAQCWKPFGQRRQICCEQIEIKASDRSIEGLPWVVLPLAVPDLPLILWCRSTRLMSLEQFPANAAMARKVIFDSASMGPDALRQVSRLMSSGRLVGDLSWTRLTRWREMLSQVFENRENLARLASLRRLTVDFGALGPAANWYMAAWIRDALSGIANLELAVNPSDGKEPSLTLEGEGFRVELAREDERLIVSVDGLSNCTSLSRPTDYSLMREELALVRRDLVFETTVASALRLAYPNE